MKIIELVIDENEQDLGVYAVSVVDDPAIEEDFVKLSKVKTELATVDNEKRILMGPALIPNKQIYRKNEKHGEFYIYFSQDTVRKASEIFFQKGYQNNATYEHNKQLDGMTVVESWLIDDPAKDKSTIYGFDLPKGTWMISTAGKTFSNITVNGAGITLTLGDDLSISTRTLTVTAGTFNTANFNVIAGVLSSSGTSTRTITLGSSFLDLSSGGTAVNFATSTNLTFNANTSQINLTGLSPLFSGGGQTFNNVSFTATSLVTASIS